MFTSVSGSGVEKSCESAPGSTTADAFKGIKDGQLDVMSERFCFWKDGQPGCFLPVAVTTDQECVKPDFQGSFCVQVFLFFLRTLLC